MINESWPLRPLGELFEIGAGKTMSAAARTGVDKTPFLRTSNVFWDEIDLSTVDEMAIPAHELRGKLLTPGDLLVCEGGDIGRAAVWNGEVETMSFQNHLHRLRPMRHDVEPRFYVYFLQSGFTQLGIFEGAGNKTTIPNLSRNRLAALDVPHPGIDEQRDIARALARVRAAMKLHDKSLAVAQELKRAAMATLFTRGLKGEAQKQTDIGLVPESWETPKLEDAADILSTRMTYSTLLSLPEVEESLGRVKILGIKVADMNRVGPERPIVDAELERAIDATELEHFCAPPGTIVFPKNGAAVATNKKRRVDHWSVFDPNVMGLRARPCMSQNYLFQWMQGFDLATIVSPGPVPHFNKSDLARVGVPVPGSADEQQEIVDILDAIDRKIDLHKQKRAVLDQLFKSLLHKLMTGEIRAADLDLSVLGKAPLEGVAA